MESNGLKLSPIVTQKVIVFYQSNLQMLLETRKKVKPWSGPESQDGPFWSNLR